MLDLSILLSFVETSQFFQIELLALLASLVLSLVLSNSLPYFAASALCLLVSLGSLSYEHLRGSITSFAFPEITTTITLSTLLIATFFHAVVRRSTPAALRYHAATTLACSVCLAVKAFQLLQDTARPIDLKVSCAASSSECSRADCAAQIDRCTLVAVGFAAIHLLAALLQLHDSTTASRQALEQRHDEKTVQVV